MLNAAPIAAQVLPAPPPGPGANTAADADGAAAFAQVLGQAATQQRAATQDSGARDEAAPAADRADPPQPSPAGARAATAAARGKPSRQAATPEALAAPRNAAATDPAAPPLAALDTKSAPDDGAGPETSTQALLDLAAWVSGLALPPTACPAPSGSLPPQGDAPISAGPANAEIAAVTGQAAQRTWNGWPDADAARADAALQAPGAASAGEAAAARVAPPRDPAAAAALTRHAAADATDTQAGAEAALQSFGRNAPTRPQEGLPDNGARATALPMAVASLVPAAAWATPSTPQADLAVPPGAREFAPALGAQLAVLVRDGIEHAQLRLNPAELGPIDVRITLDGTQAQVDFAAAHAGTRQALQEAVPVLAGALRESGLTLSGGGVFEQPREPRGEARPDGPRGAAAADAGARDSAPASSVLPRLPRARGVVDLYA